jgi:hypothetical protein
MGKKIGWQKNSGQRDLGGKQRQDLEPKDHRR